jgi:hypothetical protein
MSEEEICIYKQKKDPRIQLRFFTSPNLQLVVCRFIHAKKEAKNSKQSGNGERGEARNSSFAYIQSENSGFTATVIGSALWLFMRLLFSSVLLLVFGLSACRNPEE